MNCIDSPRLRWRRLPEQPGELNVRIVSELGKRRDPEVLFWLLLLGSWQFLASPGGKNAIVGALGTAAFLVFAWTNMDRLRGLGLDHARWWSTARSNWVYAAVSGVLAGIAIFAIGTLSGQNMKLSDDWRLVALQVTLGPVLEEVVFRGYLFAGLQLACITSTGTRYGWIRCRSGSAPAAVSHAAYNLTLYAIARAMLVYSKVSASL